MIVDERIVTFINSLETENSEILEAVEQEALSTYIPIIRKEMQSFLKVLLMIQKPMCILEVGTAVGFSALLMSEAAPEGCRITTIENYEKRIPIARENFRRAGKEEQITLIEGDAMDVLKTLEGSFDFIFMDAAKRGDRMTYISGLENLIEWQKRHPEHQMVLHSDQGSVYASKAYNELLPMYGITRSMSRAGTPTDNAAMESINGWIKAELFMDLHVTGEKPVKEEVDDYILFFNEQRPAYSLGYLTPKQYRERHTPIC
nr:putative RNA methylase family UPF0020 [uncultured bacterium]